MGRFFGPIAIGYVLWQHSGECYGLRKVMVLIQIDPDFLLPLFASQSSLHSNMPLINTPLGTFDFMSLITSESFKKFKELGTTILPPIILSMSVQYPCISAAIYSRMM